MDQQLNRELVESIVFGMEDQDHRYYLDSDLGTVVPEKAGVTDLDPERFVELPPWRSIDGYNLMSRFVQTLRNPVYRERLRQILASGKGVFRQFKNTVGERGDIQRLWLQFKQREMRSVVAEWLNDQRELRGLERLELSEDEETDPLIESDFVFLSPDEEALALAVELDAAGFRENHPGEPLEMVELLHRIHQSGVQGMSSGETMITTVETPARETAGLLWAVRVESSGASLSLIRQIFVTPEYRGLGLATALLREHLLRCRREQIREVRLELVGDACDYEDSLEELGFRKVAVSLSVAPDQWYRDNEST